jgi:hypothetical protein
MSMLDHIHTFARCIAEDGHGFGRHRGDVTMTLPERQWMALVAECAARAARSTYVCAAVPRSMYEPITLSHGYGFNVIVSGPARPIPTTQPGGWVTSEQMRDAHLENAARDLASIGGLNPVSAGAEVNVPKLLVHELGIGRLYADEPDDACAAACITCGAEVPDIGPMKTPYYCQACIDLRNAKPVKTLERTLEAMYAYELAGSEAGARELLRKASGGILYKCPTCGEPECTKNHSEFV